MNYNRSFKISSLGSAPRSAPLIDPRSTPDRPPDQTPTGPLIDPRIVHRSSDCVQSMLSHTQGVETKGFAPTGRP